MPSPARRATSVALAPFNALARALDLSSSDDEKEMLPGREHLLPTSAPRSCAGVPPTPNLPLHCLSARTLACEPAQDIATALLAAIYSDTAADARVAKDALLKLQGPTLWAAKEAVEASLPGALCAFVHSRSARAHRAAILAHMARNVPTGARPLYVLSDIDNTFCPSRDRRYPASAHETTYPGQVGLYAALTGAAPGRERLTFITARFGEPVVPVAQYLSRRTRRNTVGSLQRLGVTNPSILFGSLRRLPYPTPSGINMAPLGNGKLANFERLVSVFPEYRYVFFGDSCEDDLRVAVKLLEQHPSSAAAAFVHDFDGRAGKRVSRSMRQRAEAAGVIFYTSAPGAALSAWVHDERLKLGMCPELVREVARLAQEELNAMPFGPDQDVQRACLQSAMEMEHAAIDAALGRQ